MNDLIDRRAFLAGAAAAPLVWGLRELEAQDPAPAWLDEARARMKSTGRWGVVIVAPNGEKERRAFGEALYALTELDDEDLEAHEIFSEAVVIATTSGIARARWPEAERANRILLSPEGKVLASDRVDAAVCSVSSRFGPSFARFIHGEDGSRLAERAGEILKAAPAALREAVERLDADEPEQRIQASLALTRAVESITPLLVHLARAGRSAEQRGQARLLVLRYFATFPSETVGGRLPYGTCMPKLVGSCGSWVLEGEPALGCGLGRVPRKSGRFLAFLAR
jgi:hypothetical protein